MTNSVIVKIWAMAIALLLASCTAIDASNNNNSNPVASANPQPSTSLENRSAQRIVALTSLSADIIEQLDSSKLVGISGSRLLEGDSRFAEIPRISEGRSQPNLEKIVALKPDLVIGAAGFHDSIAPKFQQLNIPIVLSDVDSWEQLEALTNSLSKSLNAKPEKLLDKYKLILDNKSSSQKSALVLVSVQPILSPNKDSWAGDMLEKFNFKNIAADLQGKSAMKGYISLSPEKILQADPEVLIVVDTGDKILDKFKSQPFWSQLKAVKSNQVYELEYYGLVNPGSIGAIERASVKLKQISSSKE
jgi:iron complex transport system substrate-binding protein